MVAPLTRNLTPEKALIFRITHRENVSWILDNGLHCRNSTVHDPGYVQIGNPELIERRRSRAVPVPPGGTLEDYVPFYFTPYSPMMLNIKTGYAGITRRENDEIVILVSSLKRLPTHGIDFVFTDRHAYLRAARFFNDVADLDEVDFELLQRRDFRRDPEDPGKLERYQAEALVHEHLAVEALMGIACYEDDLCRRIAAAADERGLELRVLTQPSWYF